MTSTVLSVILTNIMKFPRKHPRNGVIDNGGAKKEQCPNCRRSNYTSNPSIEECPDCGLVCDYWGSGANEIYRSMMQRDWQQEEYENEQQRQRDEEENGY